MATVNLPYVQIFTDRHGRRRCYYRRKGRARQALPLPESPGFLGAYAAADRQAPKDGAGSALTSPGSVSALIVAYYASAEFASRRESTQRGYRNMLDRFRAKYGDRRVSAVTTRHLDAIFEEMAKETPGAAANLRKRLRRVFRLAVKMGWRTDNPVIATDAPPRRGQGFTPWSEEDIAAYEARWPSGSRERLALALLLYTGVRRSDVVGLGRQHVRDGRIHVMPLKTSGSGKRLAIRVHPKLQREIKAAPVGMTFVLTAFGEPFTAAGFTSWFRERAEMAGLEGRTPHGLRKAAGRRMAEAGCTAKEIAAVLGHTTLAEVERYTRDADQTKLADAAVARLGNGRVSNRVKPARK